MILIPHIVSVIGLAEYGRLAVLMAWGGYGAVIVQYAFPLTGPKRIVHPAVGESIASIFIDITFAKALLLLFVILVMAILLYLWMPFESNSSLAWILIFGAPVAAGMNSVWFLQARDKFLSVCMLAIIGSLLTLFIGFTFISDRNHRSVDFSVIVCIFGMLFMGLGTLLLTFVSIRKEKYHISFTRVVNSLKGGWHLFVSQFASVLYSASGPIIINYLLDAKAAGAFSVTERVINALISAALLSHTAAYPRLAFAYISNRVDYWKILKLVLLIYLGATTAFAALAWSQKEHVINFLYGEKSNEHESLLFFGLMWMIFSVFGPVLTGYLTVSGRARDVWHLTLKTLVLSFGLGIPCIFIFGNTGWLIALLLAQFFLVLPAGFKHWRNELKATA